MFREQLNPQHKAALKVFSGFFLFLALFFIFTTPARAQVSVTSLESIIQSLQSQVLNLQVQVNQLSAQFTTPAVPAAPTASPRYYIFDQDLFFGTQSEAVKNLQEALTQDGTYSGPVTGYFGELTKAGIIRFQEKYANEILKPIGLTQGTGFFGPSTREQLNKLSVPPAIALESSEYIDLTVNNKKDITVPQGSPVILTWNVQNTDPNNPLPCTAAVDAVTEDGKPSALTDYYYSWIGPHSASGSAEVLAYATTPSYRLERIFKLTCETSTGKQTSSVSVKTTVTDPDSLKEIMIITMRANGKSGSSVAKTSVSGFGELSLSWTAVGDADPTVCTLSDIGNVIIAKNLSSSGSYSIQSPQTGQRYYINCTDADGEYAFDGVELIK